jgi:peptidoglycan hydrolase CwlO-like protein
MSNQDLINQMNADKTRLADLITTKDQQINNININIQNYYSVIDELNAQIIALESDITNLDTAIANDDLIIAFIPPDISKK